MEELLAEQKETNKLLKLILKAVESNRIPLHGSNKPEEKWRY